MQSPVHDRPPPAPPLPAAQPLIDKALATVPADKQAATPVGGPS